jgi:hypothetical protein
VQAELRRIQEPEEDVLAWGPGYKGGDLDADQAAWKDVKGGFVAAVEERGADVCGAETEEIEGASGDEVVPGRPR